MEQSISTSGGWFDRTVAVNRYSMNSYLNHNDRRRHLPARREVEVESLVVDHLLGETLGHHFGQRLLFGLRLTRKLGRSVTKPGYIVLVILQKYTLLKYIKLECKIGQIKKMFQNLAYKILVGYE